MHLVGSASVVATKAVVRSIEDVEQLTGGWMTANEDYLQVCSHSGIRM